MATTSKLSFRARNLDANKPMAVYFADELPDLSEVAPINRAVAQMPTGMEKDEEMESHLQDAILAQQASTSGIAVENHVIPTPKVCPVEDVRYNRIYPQLQPIGDQLIKVQAWLSMDQEEADYDMDSEDELWLKDRPHISPRDLEKIFEALESRSSDNQICLPDTARSVLPVFEESVVDDVYDYWLNKRKEVTTSRGLIGCGGLIPRIRTEAKKDGNVNPYVAFRRRAEKMQTRKNRKNDEDSYEKVLKIGHDLRRTVTLVDLVKKREKMKMVLLEEEMEILRVQMELGDFDGTLCNQVMQGVKSESPPIGPLREENGVPRKKAKKKKIRVVAAVDRELPNKAWLKKNAEVWNMPPSLSGVFSGVSPVLEVDKSVSSREDGDVDGPYTFKRRKNCVYRAAKSSILSSCEPSSSAGKPPESCFYATRLQNCPGSIHPIGFARRRCGRGGRVIFDRLTEPRVPVNGNPVQDPFCQGMDVDEKVSFSARVSRFDADNEDEPVYRRGWEPDSDTDIELAWLASARSPSPPLDDHPRSMSPDICPSPSPNMPNGSGNGMVGRVDHPAPCSNSPFIDRASLKQSQVSTVGLGSDPTVESVRITCEAAMGRDDSWMVHENSRSPSESNSSAEWTPPASHRTRLIMSSFVTLKSEEESAARTGDHPRKPSKPATSHHIKSVVGATVEGLLKQHALLAPAPSVG